MDVVVFDAGFAQWQRHRILVKAWKPVIETLTSCVDGVKRAVTDFWENLKRVVRRMAEVFAPVPERRRMAVRKFGNCRLIEDSGWGES